MAKNKIGSPNITCVTGEVAKAASSF